MSAIFKTRASQLGDHMPYEHSKSMKRRYNDGHFHARYFVGQGIDVGGKPDPLGQYRGIFRNMGEVRVWDLEDGDAQMMASVADNTYDFLASSHCLEHMHDPREAFGNWIRIVKPGGFLVVTVPDEDLYEQGVWPSRFNSDHKVTFTIHKAKSWSPVSINVTDLLAGVSEQINIERIQLINDFYRDDLRQQGIDQTRTIVAECCIEFIVQKNH